MLAMELRARQLLPSALARGVKRFGVYPRYYRQSQLCRQAFHQLEGSYPQRILFIAGLPKSGTTWLEKMLTTYPGINQLLIPDVAVYELRTGGSHDYDLPADIFSRFENMLVLTKMHVHGSPRNVALLRQAAVRYVILFRDLRDVAVSYYFYVGRTPWHPQYPLYVNLPPAQGLAQFARDMLPAYRDWVYSWHHNRDPEMSLQISYEEMLADAESVLMRVATLFSLDNAPQTIKAIVAQNSFARLRGSSGENSRPDGFFRKGISGDWRNHFTSELRQTYKQIIGDFLVKFGYERDLNW